MKKVLISIATFCMLLTANAQVGINTENVHQSAVLDIVSPAHDKGVLLPYLTTAQHTAIVNPADGLMVYNPETACFHYFKAGLGWHDVCGSRTATFSTNCDSLTITVQGAYVKGQRLDGSNTIMLHCYVKKAGVYTVAAAAGLNNGSNTTDNGYAFSATGVAHREGWLDIVMQGIGTPLNFQVDKVHTLVLQGTSFHCPAFPTIPVEKDVATYSLICNAITVAGEYRKGVPLNGLTNYIDINVNVSQLGSYYINATSQGGISFEVTSEFTVTGNQTVRLHGMGTPTTNESITINIHSNTLSGNANCTATALVTLPVIKYAVIGNDIWSWNRSNPRTTSLESQYNNFGPNANATFRTDGFIELWATTSASTVVTNLTTPGRELPDIILFYSYNFSNAGTVMNVLDDYVNRGGCLLFGTTDGNTTNSNALINSIFGIANACQTMTAVVGNYDDFIYPINYNLADPIINGPFGDLAGKYWGEDNYGTIVTVSMPPGAVQICPARTSKGASGFNDIHPEYSVVWYHPGKNFVYFGDSTGSLLTNAGTRDYPAYFPNHKPTAKLYGHPSDYVYNAQLEFNAIAYLIKKACISGINPH